MNTKFCSGCDQELPIEKFYKSKTPDDKSKRWCRDCSCAYQRNLRKCRARYYKQEPAQTTEKKCSICKKVLSADNFSKDSNAPGGLNYKCKVCTRNQQLLMKFGITLEEYNKLLESQNGVCAICGKPPGKKQLAVDHDHETSRVRGLLCSNCNHGLGNFKDTPKLLFGAIGYLSPNNSVAEEEWPCDVL